VQLSAQIRRWSRPSRATSDAHAWVT